MLGGRKSHESLLRKLEKMERQQIVDERHPAISAEQTAQVDNDYVEGSLVVTNQLNRLDL